MKSFDALKSLLQEAMASNLTPLEREWADLKSFISETFTDTIKFVNSHYEQCERNELLSAVSSDKINVARICYNSLTENLVHALKIKKVAPDSLITEINYKIREMQILMMELVFVIAKKYEIRFDLEPLGEKKNEFILAAGKWANRVLDFHKIVEKFTSEEENLGFRVQADLILAKYENWTKLYTLLIKANSNKDNKDIVVLNFTMAISIAEKFILSPYLTFYMWAEYKKAIEAIANKNESIFAPILEKSTIILSTDWLLAFECEMNAIIAGTKIVTKDKFISDLYEKLKQDFFGKTELILGQINSEKVSHDLEKMRTPLNILTKYVIGLLENSNIKTDEKLMADVNLLLSQLNSLEEKMNKDQEDNRKKQQMEKEEEIKQRKERITKNVKQALELRDKDEKYNRDFSGLIEEMEKEFPEEKKPDKKKKKKKSKNKGNVHQASNSQNNNENQMEETILPLVPYTIYITTTNKISRFVTNDHITLEDLEEALKNAQNSTLEKLKAKANLAQYYKGEALQIKRQKGHDGIAVIRNHLTKAKNYITDAAYLFSLHVKEGDNTGADLVESKKNVDIVSQDIQDYFDKIIAWQKAYADLLQQEFKEHMNAKKAVEGKQEEGKQKEGKQEEDLDKKSNPELWHQKTHDRRYAYNQVRLLQKLDDQMVTTLREKGVNVVTAQRKPSVQASDDAVSYQGHSSVLFQSNNPKVSMGKNPPVKKVEQRMTSP